MLLKGTVRVINYTDTSFINEKGATVNYSKMDFCDDIGNKFSGSVPKSVNSEDIDIQKNSVGEPVEGEITLNVTRELDKERNTYTKMQVVGFTSK